MPDENLKPSLLRGPTPPSPSYIISRKALTVVNAVAGANSDKAGLSYDDNESTDWVNDGNAATAWIEYELAELPWSMKWH